MLFHEFFNEEMFAEEANAQATCGEQPSPLVADQYKAISDSLYSFHNPFFSSTTPLLFPLSFPPSSPSLPHLPFLSEPSSPLFNHQFLPQTPPTLCGYPLSPLLESSSPGYKDNGDGTLTISTQLFTQLVVYATSSSAQTTNSGLPIYRQPFQQMPFLNSNVVGIFNQPLLFETPRKHFLMSSSANEFFRRVSDSSTNSSEVERRISESSLLSSDIFGFSEFLPNIEFNEAKGASVAKHGGGAIRRGRSAATKSLIKCDFPDCEKEFSRKFNMEEHKKTHDPNRPRPFTCSQCPKAFVRDADLERHLHIHKKVSV